MGDDFYEHKLLTLKRDHVQFNLFNSIINVAAVDWFLFASNPTGRCFSHSFDLLSVQHGTYILQMLLRIYTRSLHQNISKYFLKIFSKYLKIFSLRTTWHVHPPHVASHLHSEFAWKYFLLWKKILRKTLFQSYCFYMLTKCSKIGDNFIDKYD